jgi:hypothetical protein
MKESTLYLGIYEEAFANPLKTLVHDGYVDGEIVTDVWYQLSLEDAKRFIKDDEYTELKIEEGNELLDSWIKLITTEHKNTGETRYHWSTSLRPYVQGYGCDGTTDPNIHAIANRLAEQHGLDYRSLLARAYPNQYSLSDDFSWFTDEVVLAETIIPDEIDPDLALSDLEQINNHTLAMEFGIELYRLGAISTNWDEFKQNLKLMEKQIQQDMFEWFSNKAASYT